MMEMKDYCDGCGHESNDCVITESEETLCKPCAKMCATEDSK